MIRTVRTLRTRRYDLAITPHSSGRTHLILWLSHIPCRIGFDRGLLPYLLTDKIKHPDNMHKINKNLMLLSFISPKNFDMQTELFPAEADIKRASQLISQLPAKRFIAMAPGSIWATKCWSVDSYAKLSSALCENGIGTVLIGAEADKQKCDTIEHLVQKLGMGELVCNLAGKTNLLESASIISKCALILCNDSGAMHIANAVKTKVFAFFGPTVQSIGYYPYRDGDRVFEVNLECRPCGSHGADKCPLKHHDCMKLIKPEAVLSAILAELPHQSSI